jgi:hypothetical protein
VQGLQTLRQARQVGLKLKSPQNGLSVGPPDSAGLECHAHRKRLLLRMPASHMSAPSRTQISEVLYHHAQLMHAWLCYEHGQRHAKVGQGSRGDGESTWLYWVPDSGECSALSIHRLPMARSWSPRHMSSSRYLLVPSASAPLRASKARGHFCSHICCLC